jgi:hypothetical protein
MLRLASDGSIDSEPSHDFSCLSGTCHPISRPCRFEADLPSVVCGSVFLTLTVIIPMSLVVVHFGWLNRPIRFVNALARARRRFEFVSAG